jgi:HEAT repeat protein
MMIALLSVVVSLPLLTGAAISNPSGEAQAGVAEVTRLLGDPCWQVRLWSADVLGQINPPALQAVDDLKNRAGDPSEQPLVRSSALKALAKMGSSANGVVSDLPRLLADPNWLVRQSAAEASEGLGRGSRDDVLKTLPGVQRLLKDNPALSTEFDHYAQGPTAELLAVVPSLIDLLHDPQYDVRRLSADVLGGVGWSVQESLKGGQEFIAAVTKADKSWDAKEKSVITGRLAVAGTLFAQIEAALAAELGDWEPPVRVAAVAALRRMLREKAVPRLTGMAAVEPHPGVQRSIADALGSIGAEVKDATVVAAVETALIDLLGRADAQTRESAVAALGLIVPGTESVTAKLKTVLLNDPDTRVKTAALAAIQVRSPHPSGM